MRESNKRKIFKILSVTLLIILWKISAVIIAADIILPTPEKVLLSIISVFNRDLLNTLFATIERGFTGFLLSLFSGLIVGIFAGLNESFKSFMKPIISITRSTPVVSVILLALIWFNVDRVPVFVAFLMAFPIISGNIIEGMSTIDKNLLEMAKLYKVSAKSKILNIYIPSITPFIISASSVSLGIVWKAVVAAEVLSQPKWGIGTNLNEAKAFLITEEVFAWTAIALVSSSLTDRIFTTVSNRFDWRKRGN